MLSWFKVLLCASQSSIPAYRWEISHEFPDVHYFLWFFPFANNARRTEFFDANPPPPRTWSLYINKQNEYREWVWRPTIADAAIIFAHKSIMRVRWDFSLLAISRVVLLFLREMPRLQKSRQIRISAPLKSPWRKTAKCCAPPAAAAGIGLFSSRRAFKIAAHLDKLVALNFHFLWTSKCRGRRFCAQDDYCLCVFFFSLWESSMCLNGSVKMLRPAAYIYLF